jgi:hypothetical protein
MSKFPEHKKIKSVPKASNFGDLLKEAIREAGFKDDTEAAKVARSLDRRILFNRGNMESWLKNKGGARGVHRNGLLLFLEYICHPDVYPVWVDAFEKFETDLKRRKKSALHSYDKCEVTNSIDQVDKFKNKKTIFLLLFTALFLLLTSIVFFYKEKNDSHPSKTINKEEPEKTYSPGLKASLYRIDEKYKIPPSSPSGFNVLNFTHFGGADFYYFPNTIEDRLLHSVLDQNTGFHYSGYILLEEAGEYVFESNYKTIQHISNQFGLKECRHKLDINKKEIFNIILDVGKPKFETSLKEIYFEKGRFSFELWFSCEDLTNLERVFPWMRKIEYDIHVYQNTYLKVYYKTPSGVNFKAIPKSILTH